MNNQSLWNSVRSFNLDESDDPYNFSVRLAFENKWSQYATQQAIIEYKKFMFLAATSNNMVSPSEIVDIVWHQHLIFTQSYNLFCALLGKRIEHIPSTHNPDEKLKFTQAKNVHVFYTNSTSANSPPNTGIIQTSMIPYH